MQKVTFLPRSVAARWLPQPGSVLISIHDRSEAQLTPQPGWSDVLYLRFHDTDGQQMGLEVFSPAQAQQVLDFVSAHQDCSELVVHCSMGHSRSAAIALFVAETHGVPCFKEQTPVTALSWKSYNRKVYSGLHTAMHGPIGSMFASAD